MKKAITCLLSLFMVGCSNGNASYTHISMDKAIQEMQNSTGYELVDVRTKKEYESGHIPGAINIVNEEIDANVKEILKDQDQIIYVYCRSGNRSKQASQKLVDLGYTNIVEIGGINAYSGEIE